MIPFEEAVELIFANTPVLPPVTKSLHEITSDVLAEDVKARADLPVFSNSAMDGFALRSGNTVSAPVELRNIGNIKAGEFPTVKVRDNETIRIMTGAPMPEGADAVAKKEDTQVIGDQILIKKKIGRSENVRFKGEEIQQGQIGLVKGTRLNPASVGLLAALGRDKAEVHRKPRMSLIVTGDELITPGQELGPGNIWESNSAGLRACLAAEDIQLKVYDIVPDDLETLKERISIGIEASDILLISGGISVGDYDFVQKALLDLDVERIFWRIAVKPGKPTFFGRTGEKLVFGLPGNPVSAIIIFLEFVRPVILKMSGNNEVHLQEKEAILGERISKKPGRKHFMRGCLEMRDGTLYVRSAGLQRSHILDSLARSDCLVILDREKEVFEQGQKVRVQILPWKF